MLQAHLHGRHVVEDVADLVERVHAIRVGAAEVEHVLGRHVERDPQRFPIRAVHDTGPTAGMAT